MGLLFGQSANNNSQSGTQPGLTSDAARIPFATFYAACDAATSAGTPLAVAQIWTVGSSGICASQLVFNGGKVRPASGKNITLSVQSAPLSAICDISLGGTCTIASATGSIYPQWWGAKCDGSTDDTNAVQAFLLNPPATGSRGQFTTPCAISRMVYIPQSGQGLTLQGPGLGAYSLSSRPAGGAALIGKSGSPPFQMLRNYASTISLQNLMLDCNKVATNGLVLAMSIESSVQSVTATQCTGDGILIDPLQTPTTTTTSAISAGSAVGSTVTVTTTALEGMRLGAGNCVEMMVEAGTERAEVLEYLSTGNTLNRIALTAHSPHPAGSTIQCNGNNDGIVLQNPIATFNRGWGLDITAQIDGNGIQIYSPRMLFNSLGGELIAGSGIVHVGGHSEGNSGPAMQLGDRLPHGRSVVFSTIGPFADLENSEPRFNAVVAVCGFNNTIQFRNPGEFLPAAAGSSCAADVLGVLDLGFGYVGNAATSMPQLVIKNVNGTVSLEPYSDVFSGLTFKNNAGTILNTLQANSVGTGGLAAGKPVTDYLHDQFEVNGGYPAAGLKLMLSMRTDTLRAFLQSTLGASSPKPLDLNPTGGSVSIGHNTGGPPQYSNNAAARAGGLVVGDIYAVAGTDPRRLAIVF